MKILSIVGARPNFMKIAPICDALTGRGISHVLVHTGQHYDQRMSQLFFAELGIPAPDIDLGVGSGSAAEQTAEVMRRLEPVLLREDPDLMIVVGDVNSTMAATITAAKLLIPVAHVESGLRSFDRTMPEEINRLVTDSIADYHFTTEESANRNLAREGIAAERVFFVGNTMIDTLLKHLPRAESSSILDELHLAPRGFGVVTLHRPSNVDTREGLAAILGTLHDIARDLPLVFPVHPRTRQRIASFGLEGAVSGGVVLIEPLGYLDFLKLMKESRLILTDSGGIQEEATILKVPCLTMRHNTERPVTVSAGSNVLVGTDRREILATVRQRLSGYRSPSGYPPLWDGHAAERIVETLLSLPHGT